MDIKLTELQFEAGLSLSTSFVDGKAIFELLAPDNNTMARSEDRSHIMLAASCFTFGFFHGKIAERNRAKEDL